MRGTGRDTVATTDETPDSWRGEEREKKRDGSVQTRTTDLDRCMNGMYVCVVLGWSSYLANKGR